MKTKLDFVLTSILQNEKYSSWKTVEKQVVNVRQIILVILITIGFA
jgi:hypothetical protein